jgi:hypothetical protein
VGIAIQPNEYLRETAVEATANVLDYSIEATAQVTANLVLLSRRLNAEWDLVATLFLSVTEDENGVYVVSDDRLPVYGDGNTVQLALKDYVTSLIEYYEIVEQAAKSSPHSQMLFNHLRQYVRRVPC